MDIDEEIPEDITDIDEEMPQQEPIDDLEDIDEAPITAEELADELDDLGDIDEGAPIAESQEEEVTEEQPVAEEEVVAEEQPEEVPAEEEAQAEPAISAEDVAIDSNKAVEDLVSSIYTPIEGEEEPTEEAAQEEEVKEEQPEEASTAPEAKVRKSLIGGEPLPEGLYEEVPAEEEAAIEEQPQEEAAEEAPVEEKEPELSEDEKALMAMMQEAEDEDAQAQQEEANLDRRRVDLDTAMSDPRYNAYTAFEKKLIAATDRQRKYYSSIKNTFFLYSRISSKIANAGESFRQGSKLIARITLNNDKLRLHLCLEPNAYNPRQYHHYSMAKYAAYSEVPFALDIDDATALANALKLIGEAVSTKFLFAPNKKWQQVDYAAQYTVDDNGNLPPKTE